MADLDTKRPARPFRLYLVEDSPIMLALLRDLLEVNPLLAIAGHAAQARIAIAEIATLAPDVVIVDIALDNSNGFDVLKALTARAERERPVIMVLSNFATKRYRDEAMRLKADYFFDKSREIVQMVEMIIGMAKAAASRTR